MIDAVGDCKLIPDATGLTISVPGKLHVLSPELNIKNSPMVLIDVEGDFVAQVKVAGEVMPGRTPVEKMPFAFHGAGLLLWKDKDNYVRLERAGAGASRASAYPSDPRRGLQGRQAGRSQLRRLAARADLSPHGEA